MVPHKQRQICFHQKFDRGGVHSMQEIANSLKSQREAQGLTLEDVFQRTRINPEFLEALETGHFDVLPPTYVRLFLKTYAREIGLNPNEVLKRYEAHMPAPPTPVVPARPERSASIPVIALSLIFIVSAIVVALQVITSKPSEVAVPLDATVEPPYKRPEPVASTIDDSTQEKTATTETDTTPVFSPSALPKTQEETAPAPPVSNPLQENMATLPSTPPGMLQNMALPSLLPQQTTAAAQTIQPAASISELPVQTPIQGPENTSMPGPTASLETVAQPASSTSEPEILSTYEYPITANITDGPIIISGLIREKTHLSIYADGRTLYSGELRAGSRHRWQASDTFQLLVEKAGAVALSVQDQELAPSSPPNRSLRLFVTRTRIRIEELAPAQTPTTP